MRWIIIIALALLLTTETWAGTFRDDFEDGNLSGWQFDKNNWKDVEFQVEKGEACIKTNSPPPIGTIGARWLCKGTMMIGKDDWRNYSLELRVKIVEADYGTGGNAIIGIRAEENPRGNVHGGPIMEIPGIYMEIVADPAGIFGWITVHKVIKIDPPIVLQNNIEQTRRWEQVFQDGVKWTIAFDTWYPVKMAAKDNHFKLYFNDELVTSFDDADTISGKVRLSAITAHVHFDDVVITGENVPDIGPSGMAVSAKGKLATTWGNVKQLH